MSRRDLYETLGVGREASVETIKAAHRKAVKRTHPDRGGDRREFEAAQRAWVILGNPERRKRYDATGDESDAGRADAPCADAPEQILAACWEEVLNECEPAEDLIAMLAQKLDLGAAKAEGRAGSAKDGRNKWETMLARLKVTNEAAGILALAIRDKLAALQREVEQMEWMAEKMKAAKALLEGVTYEVPKSEREKGEKASRDRLHGMMMEMIEGMGGGRRAKSDARQAEEGPGPGRGEGRHGRAECCHCGKRFEFIRGDERACCPRCQCPEVLDLEERRRVDLRVEGRRSYASHYQPMGGYGL